MWNEATKEKTMVTFEAKKVIKTWDDLRRRSTIFHLERRSTFSHQNSIKYYKKSTQLSNDWSSGAHVGVYFQSDSEKICSTKATFLEYNPKGPKQNEILGEGNFWFAVGRFVYRRLGANRNMSVDWLVKYFDGWCRGTRPQQIRNPILHKFQRRTLFVYNFILKIIISTNLEYSTAARTAKKTSPNDNRRQK